MNSSADQQLPTMDNITFLLTSNDRNSTVFFMETTQIPSDSDEQSLCVQIELTLKKPLYLTVLHVNLLILATTLASIAFLVQKYTKERIIAHGNLLLLFANIILLYFIHNLAYFVCFLRYRVLLFFYTEPCQLLTPFWMVALLYGPSCVYLIAYPALHFCVMVERIRATLLAENYEREGQKLGIWMVLTIWLISFAFTAFVIGTDLADPAMAGRPQGVLYLTSRDNAIPIFYMSIFTLFLVISTAIFDWRITVLNRRVRLHSKHWHNYSLSRNYQLKENVLAMRLILPLDMSYALFYSVYNALVILIRAFQAKMSTDDYDLYYDMANMLLFIHSAVTILVYIRFMRFLKSSQKRNIGSRPQSEHTRIYFTQLAAQWG